jgi:hypothetical protein
MAGMQLEFFICEKFLLDAFARVLVFGVPMPKLGRAGVASLHSHVFPVGSAGR